MQPRDKISKSSWTLQEGIKDSAAANLTSAVRSGQLKVEAAELEKLLAIVGASIEEGYHRGHGTFMKGVDTALGQAAETAATEALMPDLKKGSAKKK